MNTKLSKILVTVALLAGAAAANAALSDPGTNYTSPGGGTRSMIDWLLRR